jgi:gluconolactonase
MLTSFLLVACVTRVLATLQDPGMPTRLDPALDATPFSAKGVPDGMKVDKQGNLYCTGPGGVLIFSPKGKHLGTIPVPEVTANLHWGDADGKTLYITAETGLYRIRLLIAGLRP